MAQLGLVSNSDSKALMPLTGVPGTVVQVIRCLTLERSTHAALHKNSTPSTCAVQRSAQLVLRALGSPSLRLESTAQHHTLTISRMK